MLQDSIAIIANARRSLPKWMTNLIASHSLIICLDGSFAGTYKAGIKPSLILGDLDSITKAELNSAQEANIPILSMPDQDLSDLAKAIQYCLSHYQNKKIYIYNALGGERLDHTLVNLSYLKKFFIPTQTIIITEQKQHTYFCRNAHITVHGDIGSSFAIIPMPQALVTSKGLKYDMQAMKLELGVCSSSSNALVRNEAFIEIYGDCLIISHNKQEIVIKHNVNCP